MVESVYFEGGEPFLFYPLMVEGIRLANEMGLKAGIVTNAYWATSVEDAGLWLRPLAGLVSDFSVSDDVFHYGEDEDRPPRHALEAARQFGMPASAICIERPKVVNPAPENEEKGAPVIGGGAKFRGRAVEKLLDGLPCRPREDFIRCPYEDLADPKRVHVDALGNVHLCQGVVIGNVREKALARVLADYDPSTHPVAGLLLRGGPARLIEEQGLSLASECVDECHACFLARRELLDRFPSALGPRQVYGVE